MIHSMTGFARETGGATRARWAWEIRSVNGKSLDARVRTPPGFDELAEEARKRIAAALRRGTIHAGLTINADERPAARVRINEPLLDSLIEVASRFAGRGGIAPATLDGLLSVRGVVETDEGSEDEGERRALNEALLAGLDRLLASMLAARRSEGAALAAILSGQLDAIARLAGAADVAPARRPEAIARRLTEGIAALTAAAPTLDPARLHQEALLLAGRADIREEIDRLHAHVAAARDLLAGSGAVGRRLDFLAQEMAREASTLTAKSGDLALTRIGLELKSAVEQVREQVQNVE